MSDRVGFTPVDLAQNYLKKVMQLILLGHHRDNFRFQGLFTDLHKSQRNRRVEYAVDFFLLLTFND